MRRATYNMQHATCSTQHAARNMPRAAYACRIGPGRRVPVTGGDALDPAGRARDRVARSPRFCARSSQAHARPHPSDTHARTHTRDLTTPCALSCAGSRRPLAIPRGRRGDYAWEARGLRVQESAPAVSYALHLTDAHDAAAPSEYARADWTRARHRRAAFARSARSQPRASSAARHGVAWRGTAWHGTARHEQAASRAEERLRRSGTRW